MPCHWYATRRPAAAVTADNVTTYAQYVKTRPARTCSRPPFLANSGTQNAARPTNPVATCASTSAFITRAAMVVMTDPPVVLAIRRAVPKPYRVHLPGGGR